MFVRDYIVPLLDLPFVQRSLPKARRMLRHPWRELSNNYTVLRDVERFRRIDAPHLIAAAGVGRPSDTVLIVSLSPIVYRVKLEAMFAVAMARAGCRPVVLTTRATGDGYPYAYLEYFRALPFVDLVMIEDEMPDLRDAALQSAARDIEERFWRTREWNEFNYLGLDLGRHMKSALCRNLRLAEVDLENRAVRSLLKRLLPHFLGRAVAAERIFERIRPKAAFFQDVIYLNYGALFESAVKRGIDVIQHMPCQWQDNSLILRRFTTANRLEHPNSLSRQTWREFLSVPWSERWHAETKRMIEEVYGCSAIVTKRNQGGKAIIPPDEVRAQLCIPDGKFVACIFSHILWDSNGAFGEDLYPDFAEWLVDTLRVGRENPDIFWLVKLHPDSEWKRRLEGWSDRTDEVDYLKERLGDFGPNIKFIRPDTNINTFSLFAVIDCGITVKGSIAYQLPVYGVRALTAGRSKFCGMGFTDDSATVEEYREKIARLPSIGRATQEQTAFAVRYVFAQFRLKPWVHTSFCMLPDHSDTPGHPLWWDLRVADGVAEARDLDSLARWVLEERRDDYLDLSML